MDINQIKLDNKFKLVEASAGTGKSFTLAHLVLRNVLEKKVKPDEILLLSFTKNTCSVSPYLNIKKVEPVLQPDMKFKLRWKQNIIMHAPTEFESYLAELEQEIKMKMTN